MNKLLDEREQGDFESFEDIRERVSSLPDPEQLIIDRIIEELKGDSNKKLFTSA